MTEAEIVELFGTTAGTIRAAIKAILKENALHDYEVCKCIRLDSGNSADVYHILKWLSPLRFRIRSQAQNEITGSITPYTRCSEQTACNQYTDGLHT